MDGNQNSSTISVMRPTTWQFLPAGLGFSVMFFMIWVYLRCYDITTISKVYRSGSDNSGVSQGCSGPAKYADLGVVLGFGEPRPRPIILLKTAET